MLVLSPYLISAQLSTIVHFNLKVTFNFHKRGKDDMQDELGEKFNFCSVQKVKQLLIQSTSHHQINS